LAKVAVMHFWK